MSKRRHAKKGQDCKTSGNAISKIQPALLPLLNNTYHYFWQNGAKYKEWYGNNKVCLTPRTNVKQPTRYRQQQKKYINSIQSESIPMLCRHGDKK